MIDQREPLPFTAETFEDRRERVRRVIAERGLDAILVTAPENIFYLSAFHTPAYDNFQFLLLTAGGRAVMFNNLHESEFLVAARSQVTERAAYATAGARIAEARALMEREGLAAGRIGLDKSSFFVTVREYEALLAALPRAAFVDTAGLVEEFRKVKSPEELAVMREAARVCDAGVLAGVEASRAGAVDYDIAAAVHHALVAAGGDYMSYPPFVNVGWNSSLCHNTWNGRRLGSGDTVFIEISGVVNRYGVALMRSVNCGRLDAETARRDRIVQDVLARTLDAVRPGVTAGEVNASCVAAYGAHGYKVLKRAGYSMGINFPPGWSEGNFLDLSPDNPIVLEPGMVFHCPQPFRVRGEQTISVSETVVVTPNGCEPLGRVPRQLFRT